MPVAESNVQSRSLLAVGARPDVRLFRNHVGAGWMGDVVRKDGNRVLLNNARYAAFGLATGSSDLVGLQALTIGLEHVGRTLAVFLSAECKRAAGGVIAEGQDKWAALMQRMGARHAFIRSPDDMMRLVACPES